MPSVNSLRLRRRARRITVEYNLGYRSRSSAVRELLALGFTRPAIHHILDQWGVTLCSPSSARALSSSSSSSSPSPTTSLSLYYERKERRRA